MHLFLALFCNLPPCVWSQAQRKALLLLWLMSIDRCSCSKRWPTVCCWRCWPKIGCLGWSCATPCLTPFGRICKASCRRCSKCSTFRLYAKIIGSGYLMWRTNWEHCRRFDRGRSCLGKFWTYPKPRFVGHPHSQKKLMLNKEWNTVGVIGGKRMGIDFYSRKNCICIEIADDYLVGCGHINRMLVECQDLLDVGNGPLDWRWPA